ncbi:two-CW domain-containing protein [Methanosphaerula subterraneus]|uniref:two-CW domain-containing protein n=1 Tax=Methanosphaerula subterraneus TaxID=3350244 RepID=UPI003F85A7B4
MTHLNCWEFKKCGREPGGENASELGICPASTETLTDGVNHGKNGGRACWAISGTMCGGKVQGTFATKVGTCLNCEFYQQVQWEEKPRFETSSKILARLNK